MARGKLEALDKALNKKYKDYECKIIQKGDDDSEYMIVPTDSIALNRVLGNGGIPLGTLILLSGPESGGKTALGFAMLSAIQKNISKSGKKDQDGDLITTGNVALIDAERSYTKSWTEKLGVDTSDDRFRRIVPPSGEVGLEFVEELIRSGLYDGILIDSLNGLLPVAMMENEVGDATMGMQARMYSKAYARIVGLADTYKTSLISISQERNAMDKYAPTVYAGGKSTRFYNHIILDVRRSEFLGSKDEPIGLRSKIKAKKNKCAVPYKIGEIDLYYENGFSFIVGTIEMAANLGLIKKGGAWYTLNNGEKFQGKESVAEYFGERPDEYKELFENVNNVLNMTLKEEKEAIINGDKKLIDEDSGQVVEVKEEDLNE